MILAIFVIVFVGLLVYGFYYPRGSAPDSTSTSNGTGTANINCIQSSDYFVIDKNPTAPGLDIVAKHKTSADEVIACTNIVASSDVVLQNDLPEQVLGVTGKFLIVDSGTAPPPRGLIIYDLDAQTSTYGDTYSEPLTIATDSVTYWASTRQAVTAANCPDLAQYTKDGLGAVIESHVTLDLTKLIKTSLGEFRCEPTQ